MKRSLLSFILHPLMETCVLETFLYTTRLIAISLSLSSLLPMTPLTCIDPHTQLGFLIASSSEPSSKVKRQARSYWLKSFSRKMTVSCKQQLNKMKNYANRSGSDSSSGTGSDSSSGSCGRKKNRKSSSSQQQQRRRLSSAQQALFEYVPAYLMPFLHPYHGEFCYTPIFQSHFIAQLMAEGFLPVASSRVLLPKLHVNRSVIALSTKNGSNNSSNDSSQNVHDGGLHVSKSVRKKSKRFTLTVNQRFDEVVQGCRDQHGSHCWLYPPLVQAFREIFQAGAMDAAAMDPITGRPLSGRSWKVRLYTIEVWNVATGALAGGEIGYTVGSIYTSLTGFTKEDSAGSVQLAALGRLLSERGFHLWDLGMDMEYKQGIGARAMPRDTFVREVHRVRETQGHLALPAGEPAQSCKDIIDRNAPPVAHQSPAAQAPLQKAQPKQYPKKKKAPKPAEEDTASSTNAPAVILSPESGSKGAANGKLQSHSPPVSGAQAPMKKVRKSDSQPLE